MVVFKPATWLICVALGKYSSIIPGSFYQHGLTLIPALNRMPSKLRDQIRYPFPNFNGRIVEVWDWVSDLIADIKLDVITYSYWNHN